MNFRNVADLNQQLVRSLSTLPQDLDLVVGIPRSGLLVANLLALHLNVPMTDVDGLITGRVIRTGSRYARGSTEALFSKRCNVLVVDDSVCSGRQMREVRQRIKQARLPHRIRFGAVYVLPETAEARQIDWFAEILSTPRVFEWNLMHNEPVLFRTCMEIDGVLCHAPNQEAVSDAHYRHLLHNAVPKYLPSHPVGWLITSRPERYRALTERWLARHGICYAQLVMMPSDVEAVQDDQCTTRFKAEAYKAADSPLFISDAPSQAARIADLTGKPVVSMQTCEMLHPGDQTHRTLLPAGATTLRFHPLDGIRQLSNALVHRLLQRARRHPAVAIMGAVLTGRHL